MKKYSENDLKNLTTDDLLNMLSPSFNISKTYFDDPYKQYIIKHNYTLIAEVNLDPEIDLDENPTLDRIHNRLPDVTEWETFGYPVEHLLLAATPEVYGSTAKLCLINFFVKHPEHLTIKG